MKLRKLNKSNDGVVGIVVAILLVGLFISIIAFVQTVYVPQWMEKKEAEHMDQVANQFTQLKFAIDTLSVAAQKHSPISSSITLGSQEMPFLSSNRAYGSLDILPNNCKISIVDINGNSIPNLNLLGSIKYSSQNAYYLDRSYIYENGAVILSQSNQDLMCINPSFEVIDMEDLSFNIVKISGIGEKTSASGYGTYPLQTKFLSSASDPVNHVKQINITTSYKNAWYNFFDDILSNSAINYKINDTVYDDGIIITFFPDDDDQQLPELFLKIVDIEIQISPGWVE